MNFTENYKIDYKKIPKMVEKKGKYDYMSWSQCQKIMREELPNMKWKPVWNEQTQSLKWDGFVKILITNVDGDKVEDWEVFYPITNHNHEPITNPTQTEINKSVMRAFAKGFAMITGHSLSLYTNEDLEQYETVEEIRAEQNELKELTTKLFNHPEIGALNKKQIDTAISQGVDRIKDAIKHLDKKQIEKTKKDLGENNE